MGIKRSLIHGLIAAGVIVASVNTSAEADGDAPLSAANDRSRTIGEHWQGQCRGHTAVTRFGGTSQGVTSMSVMATGVQVLERYGMADRLARLKTGEACLSIIASEAASLPVIVVDRIAETGGDNAVSDAMRYLVKPGQKEFEKRLRELDVGYSNAGDPIASTSQTPFPQKRINAQIRATALSGYAQPRSFSQGFPGHCLVGLDTRAFDAYLNGLDRKLVAMMPESDQRWLSEHGSRVEFWHEVGHCRWHSITARSQQDIEQEPILEGAGATRTGACSVAASDAQGNGAPSSALGANEKGMVRRLLEGEQGNARAQTTPGAGTARNPMAIAAGPDQRIIRSITHEAMADAYAMSALNARFQTPIEGCSWKRELDPWARFRLISSVHGPRPGYMSWLVTYLSGQPPEVQRQVIADAWKGVRDVAFGEFSGIARPGQLAGTTKPGSRYIAVPTNKPDAARAKRWQNWIHHWLSHDPKPDELSTKSNIEALEAG